MSDIRIGIVSEGPLDQKLITSIVNAEFPDKSIIYSNISPTEDEISTGKKEEGFGWGGVYKICKNLDTKLEMLKAAGMEFDLLIIHVDGDVMMATYPSAGINIIDETDGQLPCFEEDDSIENNCRKLTKIVDNWYSYENNRIVHCIPYINSDVWVAYALYEEHRELISEALSKEELDQFLLRRTKSEGRLFRMHQGKIKKNTRVYNQAIYRISTQLLEEMKGRFLQLDRFCVDLDNKISC